MSDDASRERSDGAVAPGVVNATSEATAPSRLRLSWWARLQSSARGAWRRLRGGRLSPGRLGGSVALGLFVGCLPLYGLHFPLCLAGGVAFGLDVVVAYAAAHISIPVFAPFLLVAAVQLGSLALGGSTVDFDFSHAEFRDFGRVLLQLGVGSVLLGTTLGVVGGGIAGGLAHFFERRRARTLASEGEAALRRTVARYVSAPRGDRHYVSSKLRFDPVTRGIERVGAERPFGRLIDAGAGRGQLGLFALELGVAHAVVGFDYDERKVAVARSAAQYDARFEVGDLKHASFVHCDTVLLVDVLHYLPPEFQDDLLERAYAGIEPGGRIVVRETNRAGGPGAWLARAFEAIATLTGYNRGQRLWYRSRDELVAVLRRAGAHIDEGRGDLLSNVLVVAEKPRG